jgi:hypothetical protein
MCADLSRVQCQHFLKKLLPPFFSNGATSLAANSTPLPRGRAQRASQIRRVVIHFSVTPRSDFTEGKHAQEHSGASKARKE